MASVRVVLSLLLLAAHGLAAGGAIAHEAEDDCCAAEDGSSERDGCPCPDDCDSDCVCCVVPAAEPPPRIAAVAIAFERVRYLPRIERSPASADPEGPEPVPRTLA